MVLAQVTEKKLITVSAAKVGTVLMESLTTVARDNIIEIRDHKNMDATLSQTNMAVPTLKVAEINTVDKAAMVINKNPATATVATETGIKVKATVSMGGPNLPCLSMAAMVTMMALIRATEAMVTECTLLTPFTVKVRLITGVTSINMTRMERN